MSIEVLTIDTGAPGLFTDAEEELFSKMQQAEDDGNEELFQQLLDELLILELGEAA